MVSINPNIPSNVQYRQSGVKTSTTSENAKPSAQKSTVAQQSNAPLVSVDNLDADIICVNNGVNIVRTGGNDEQTPTIMRKPVFENYQAALRAIFCHNSKLKPGKKIYILDNNGVAHQYKIGPEGELLATGKIKK